MIIVRVELHSAITGQVTELARMRIANDGSGTANTGHYTATTLHGRSREQLDRGTAQRTSSVRNWPRQRLHVWNLVAALLTSMGYGENHDIRRQGEMLP